MTEEITVKIKLPRPIHALVNKLAAVEGSTADEWYSEWIKREVEALLGDAHDVFDVERLVESNGLRAVGISSA